MKNIYLILILLIICYPINSVRQVITRPGLYTLGSNITYTPQFSNDTIIEIATSDVTLDLGKYILKQDVNSLLPSVNGIVVDQNLSNIIIKNGMISNLTGTGISIGAGCSRVTIENIVTNSCDLTGIECAGTVTNPITNLTMDSCWSFSCAQASTVSISSVFHWVYCIDSEMHECHTNNNINLMTNVATVLLENCKRCTLRRVIAKDNQGILSLAGFGISNSTDVYYDNCISMGNNVVIFDPSNLSLGYVIFNDTERITFEHCLAGQNNGGSFAIGFFMSGSNAQQDIFLFDCESLQNTGTSIAAGYITNSRRNNFIQCIAKGNTATGPLSTIARGFFLNSTQNNTIIDCLAAEQEADIAIGFDINGTTSCEIRNCRSYLNNGSSDANSFGFTNNFNVNTQFISNVAANNGALASNQMFNFDVGTFNNVVYGSLNAVTAAFTNLGIVP